MNLFELPVGADEFLWRRRHHWIRDFSTAYVGSMCMKVLSIEEDGCNAKAGKIREMHCLFDVAAN